MTRDQELEFILEKIINRLQNSVYTYGLRTPTFKGWVEDLNKAYTEFYELINKIPKDSDAT